MIEAVNSVVSNAPLIRVAAEQVAASRSFAGDAIAVESVARGPVAPYISPYISVDPLLDAAVLQLRDSDTGDVVEQFPSDKALLQRRQQERAEAVALAVPGFGGGDAPGIQPVAAAGGSSDFSITIVQEADADIPSATPVAAGAGAAQAAITALSVGAQVGQPTAPTLSVTA